MEIGLTMTYALLCTQLSHGKLGKQAVHAANRAQVAAPQAAFKDPGAHHGSCRDDQQQPGGQVGSVR